MSSHPASDVAPRRFLPEVQALRTFAVLAVVIFHLWPLRLGGGFIGVDVFFVISGFLITAHLMREAESTGTIKLPSFWARRIRRLLPAALLVLAATLAAVLIWMPITLWQRFVTEIGASALYILNWVLASNAVDYFAADNGETAVQHYWSLSVEEQFYLVWPVLILGLVALALRRRVRVRVVLGVGIGVIAVASLIYSIVYSYAVPSAAYFSTFTHAWEFAIGGLLAVGATRLNSARWLRAVRLRAVATWLGFAMLAFAAVTFTGATVFPGYTALLPVLGAALVIAAGDSSGPRLSLMPVLRWRPVQYIGDISYSLYLWHWPFIVIVPVALGHELTTPNKIVILAVTVVLAALTKRFVEDPIRTNRRFSRRKVFSFTFALAGAAAIVIGAAVPWTVVEVKSQNATTQVQALKASALTGEAPCFGAAAALSGADCPDSYVVNPAFLLADKVPTTVDATDGREVMLGGKLKAFVYGDDDAAHTVALVGDSHSAHYAPALKALAAKYDWRLYVVRHNNCTPSAPDWTSRYQSDALAGCVQYRHNLIDVLPTIPEIDLIVTSSVSPRYGIETAAVQKQAAAAFTTTWKSWTDAGKKVVVIADVPGTSDEVGEARDCIAEHPGVVDPCLSPRSEVLERDAMVVAAKATPLPGLGLVDFTDVYCNATECHSVLGGVVIYSGGAHLSGTFVLTLTPYLDKPLGMASF